ncbi:MAG: excinuclease ABC subunit UvrC [Candidatus Peregrinibacteria bacterium]
MLTAKEIKNILDLSPHAPGVYRMLDKSGAVIYIGKAKDLRKRLSQYFQKSTEKPMRTQKLLEKVADIKFTVVDSELEAIILETNLIKQFQPRYNILMKDGKNYVYIKITKENFPRIQIVRKMEKDNAKYIGPKTAAHKVIETLRVLKKVFPYRQCGLNMEFTGKNEVKITKKTIKYPCLDYYIKSCPGPCIGKCTPEEYGKIIKNIENFFEGKGEDALKELNSRMRKKAQNKEFEEAARIRDKIKKVKNIIEKQKISDTSHENRDIINYITIHDHAYFNLFQVRDGKLIGQENFILNARNVEENSTEQKREVLEAFLNQYYEIATNIPKEILIPHETENKIPFKTKLIVPKIGTKNKLLELSLKNAKIFADRNVFDWRTENRLTKEAATNLQKILKIPHPLKRIECYDISHLSGTETVGSMVVFTNGVPDKAMYRKFHLRTIGNKPDDYKSMREVLTRRFTKLAFSLQHKDYVFSLARKKDREFIEKHSDIDMQKTDRTLFILKKNNLQIGFIALKEYSVAAAELTNLWLKKSERGHRLGHKLIKNAILRTKSKRIYIICGEELKEYYQMAGFEEIKSVPPELKKTYAQQKKKLKQIELLAYDTKKHKPDKSFTKTPDLVIIDGGKGQLSAADKVLKELKLKIAHIALAKRLEEIFTVQSAAPIILPSNSPALNLLKRARDEAHRFAISYQRKKRTLSKFQK